MGILSSPAAASSFEYCLRALWTTLRSARPINIKGGLFLKQTILREQQRRSCRPTNLSDKNKDLVPESLQASPTSVTSQPPTWKNMFRRPCDNL